MTECIHRTQVGRGTDRSSLRRRKRLKERGINHPSISGVTTMNTLTLIKKQIDKAAALHDAQIAMTSYRGVKHECKQGGEEIHGTFCYRGRTYVK